MQILKVGHTLIKDLSNDLNSYFDQDCSIKAMENWTKNKYGKNVVGKWTFKDSLPRDVEISFADDMRQTEAKGAWFVSAERFRQAEVIRSGNTLRRNRG